MKRFYLNNKIGNSHTKFSTKERVTDALLFRKVIEELTLVGQFRTTHKILCKLINLLWRFPWKDAPDVHEFLTFEAVNPPNSITLLKQWF